MKNKWLIQLRTSKQLSQQEVATNVGIDRSYYTKIENGLTPSVKVAQSIAAFLGFEWTIFFNKNCAKNEQSQTG